MSPARRLELLGQFDEIEQSVSRIVVPAKFGDLFYALRGHIDFVQRKLTSAGEPPIEAESATPAPAGGSAR